MSLSRIPSLDVRRVQHSRTSENARNAGNVGHGTIGRNEDAKTRSDEERERKESRNRILRGDSFVRGKLEQFPGRCAPMTKARYTGKWNVLKKVGKKRIFSVRVADRAAGSRNFNGSLTKTRSYHRLRKVYEKYTAYTIRKSNYVYSSCILFV